MIQRPEACCDRARDTLPAEDKMQRAATQIARAAGILQQIADRPGKILLSANLNDGLLLDEIARDRLEILHVGSDHDGDAGDGWLDDVMAATRRERSAYEDNMRAGIETGQFSNGVEQEHAWKRDIRRRIAGCGAAAAPGEAAGFELACDSIEASGLARRQNQESTREFARQFFERGDDDIVFIDRMLSEAPCLIRTGGARGDPHVLGVKRRKLRRRRRGSDIVFEIARDGKPMGRNSELRIALEIGGALD